jgi:putative YhdH/YhfP family quinone oxidoreductase
MNKSSFPCFRVAKDEGGQAKGSPAECSLAELPEGDVLIRVDWSSLNYKDALAATGHPGVAKKLPHVPGIDAAGEVAESTHPDFSPGDPVIATSYELGAGVWGGWSRYLRAPAAWVLPLPEGLTARDAMIFGTSGLTAALSVQALQRQAIAPDRGEVVVTGATGGVGCFAVMLLAKLGYHVVAVSGKKDRHDWLKELGAERVIGREEVVDESNRPLLKSRWAGAIDTVGGKTLATLLKETAEGGCVTACGLVGGHELPLTVYPFILRGVTLAGIDTAWQSRVKRTELWRLLASDWRPPNLDKIAQEVDLADVGEAVERILRGEIAGRVVVRIGD